MLHILIISDRPSALPAIANHLAHIILPENTNIVTAVTDNNGMDEKTATALATLGIDGKAFQPLALVDINSDKPDIVITLAGQTCPSGLLQHARHYHWPVNEPDICDTKSMQTAYQQLTMRFDILAALADLPAGPAGNEFHGSIRVHNLPDSVRFYAWLLDVWPKEWTHRYAIFIRPDLDLNFVLLVSDGKTLHQDTLYHLGVGVPDRQAVIDAYHRAMSFAAPVVKPPRTTWKGTPLHELWLQDPDGTLIEIYARLTEQELAEKPADEKPWFLVPGTEQAP